MIRSFAWGTSRAALAAAALALAETLLSAIAGLRLGEDAETVALAAGRSGFTVLGVGLALAPCLGLLVAASVGAAPAARVSRRWRRRLRARLFSRRADVRRHFLAGLVAALGAIACWLLLTVHATREIFIRIQTPTYAALAVAATAAGCALVAAALLPALLRLGRFIARLPPRLPAAAIQSAILAALLIGAAAARIVSDWSGLGRYLPWHPPAVVFAAVILWCAGDLARRRTATRRVAAAAGALMLAFIAVTGSISIAAGRARQAPAVDPASLGIEQQRAGHHDHPVEPPPEPMPVILVTVDAAAALRMDLYGAKRRTMPRLTARAAGAAVFDRAFSVGPSTRLTLPPLFSGLPMTRIEWTPSKRAHAPWRNVERTMASIFADAGYRTEAVVPDIYITRYIPWITEDFHRVDDSAVQGRAGHHANAGQVTDAALTRLAKLSARDRFLLWVHYSDAHAPYELEPSVEPFPGGDVADKYDKALKQVDWHLDRLLDGIGELMGPRPRVVVVTADHGQAFDAKHRKYHQSHDLSTAVTWIPLVFWSPYSEGRRIERPTTSLDLLPTLLDATGIAADEFYGDSLLPEIAGAPERPRPILQQLHLPEYRARDREPLVRAALREDRYVLHRLVRRGREQLYDYVDDPLEERNLARSRPRLAARLSALLDRELALAGWERRDEAD